MNHYRNQKNARGALQFVESFSFRFQEFVLLISFLCKVFIKLSLKFIIFLTFNLSKSLPSLELSASSNLHQLLLSPIIFKIHSKIVFSFLLLPISFRFQIFFQLIFSPAYSTLSLAVPHFHKVLLLFEGFYFST